MNKGIIYKAWNKKSNKIYIGQSIQSLKERVRQHYKFAKEDHNYKFSNALNKYNVDDWDWEILEDNLEIDVLNEKEIYYINFYNSFNVGYNSTPGGTERFERRGLQATLENIQILYNIETKEIINIDAYTFIKTYCKESEYYSNVYEFFKGTYLRYKAWVFKNNLYLYEKELLDRKEVASERFTDKLIYRFYNGSMQICFFGLRKEFIKEYQLNKGNVSSLINKKLKSYKKWILLD